MLKVLTKTLQIRVSEPMNKSFEMLAKAHGVSVSRLVRALLWTSLNGSKDHPNRYDVIHGFSSTDKELESTLMLLDHYDIGLLECQDYVHGEPMLPPSREDDGIPEV